MRLLSPAVRSAIKARLPRGLNVGNPIVQLLLNDGRSTRLGLVNFPSFLAPAQGVDYRYTVSVFDEDGRETGSTVVDVPRYGATEVELAEVFAERLPAMGMLAVSIRPARFLSLRDRHLGRIRPHFFTLFSSPGMESVGLVHPQTHLNAPAAPERRWLSNLLIDASAVERVELFQVNPGRVPVDTEAFLHGAQGTVLARSSARIPARGTRRVVFELKPFAAEHPSVSVGLHGLAAANGKPILFLHFRDGSFTCCHA